MTFEQEQYKQEIRELQNDLALSREEQEALASQLEETGHILDEANLEVQRKDSALSQLQAVIEGKEQEIEGLRTQRE